MTRISRLAAGLAALTLSIVSMTPTRAQIRPVPGGFVIDGQFYQSTPSQRPSQGRSCVPGRTQVCDNQCRAIGKDPCCSEKKLCYDGITR